MSRTGRKYRPKGSRRRKIPSHGGIDAAPHRYEKRKEERNMKKAKRFLSVLVASVLFVTAALTLVSCGSDTKLGFKDGTFKIGATGPLTGDTSAYGISVRNGAIIAMEEINAAGGIDGILFSFDMKDDMSEAQKAANGYFALYEDGMQASIGAVTSGACKSFADVAQADGVFALTPSASAAEVIAAGDCIFRVCFGDPQQGTIAAHTLTKTYQKIGVVYDNSDTYSAGIYAAFEEEMQALGKTYETTSFEKNSNTNFSAQITKLKSAGCDVIFLPIYYTQAGLIAKEAAKQGYNVPIFGCDGLDNIESQLDDSVTAEISYCTPFDVRSTDPAVEKFVKAYTEKFGKAPDQFAADGYDAVMIIYEAMKAAGVKNVEISAADLSEILKATLTGGSFTYSGVTGKNMKWTTDGSCEKDPQIVKVER